MNRLGGGWVKGVVLVAALVAGVLATAFADEDADNASSRVARPHIVQPRGDKCVADTAWMRRNHMKLLMHHRVGAVHQGDNQLADKTSIVNCVNCHASAKDNSVTGPGDFCQSCHAYAAVKITCFECHSNKPSSQSASAFHPAVSQGAGARMYHAEAAQAHSGQAGTAARFDARDLALAGVVR